MMVNCENLSGYAKNTRESTIPGIEPFDPATSWGGFTQWTTEAYQKLQAAQAEGHITEGIPTMDVLVGVIKGYPDAAILSFLEGLARNDSRDEEVLSQVAYSDRYRCAQPNYGYGPEVANDPRIIEHQKSWSDILRAFYESDWHQSLAARPEFQDARQELDSPRAS